MNTPLAGRVILIVEDNPMIALDMEHAFQDAGATVLRARGVDEAMELIAHPELCAAVIDYGLGAGNAKEVCHSLDRRSIPFVVYSGYNELDEACHEGVFVPKPASNSVLVTTVVGLLHPGGPARSRPLLA